MTIAVAAAERISRMPVIPKPPDEPPLFGDGAQVLFISNRPPTTSAQHQVSSVPTVPVSLVERWDSDNPIFDATHDPLD